MSTRDKSKMKQSAENLRMLRKDIAHMNQHQLSVAIKIPASNISIYENGTRAISLGAADKYIEFFKKEYEIDVSLDFLFGYSNMITRDPTEKALMDRIVKLKETNKELITTYKDGIKELKYKLEEMSKGAEKCSRDMYNT